MCMGITSSIRILFVSSTLNANYNLLSTFQKFGKNYHVTLAAAILQGVINNANSNKRRCQWSPVTGEEPSSSETLVADGGNAISVR